MPRAPEVLLADVYRHKASLAKAPRQKVPRATHWGASAKLDMYGLQASLAERRGRRYRGRFTGEEVP